MSISRRQFLGLSALTALSGLTLAACTSDDKSTTGEDGGSEEQRVIALNTGQLDNLLTLGILPVGAAAAKGAKVIPEFIREEFGSDYDLDSVEDCGVRANPDLEKIASLKPTLICANSRTDEAILEQLRAIAPVVTGEGGGENWKEDLITIADAVGKKDQAQALLDQYEKDAADFGSSLSEKPTVSFLRTKDDQFQVYGVNSMAGSVAADAGLRRPENQLSIKKAGQDLSPEQLAEADAQWLFYGVQDGATSPTETSTWGSLGAVREKHAVEVDYEAWYTNASLLSATIILAGLKEHLG